MSRALSQDDVCRQARGALTRAVEHAASGEEASAVQSLHEARDLLRQFVVLPVGSPVDVAADLLVSAIASFCVGVLASTGALQSVAQQCWERAFTADASSESLVMMVKLMAHSVANGGDGRAPHDD